MIFSQNILPGNPESSYYLIQVSETTFIIIKIFISAIVFLAGFSLVLWERRASTKEFPAIKSLMIFLISQSIIELSHCFDDENIVLAVVILVASLANLIPLAIFTRTVVESSYQNRAFYKIFLLNSIFCFISILGLGIFTLSVISGKADMVLDHDLIFVQNQLDKIDSSSHNELLSLISKTNEKLDYKLHLTDEPILIIQEEDYFNERTINLDNPRGFSIVFGLPNQKAHFYLGSVVRPWAIIIIFFNLFFSISYYIYKRRS